MAIIYPGNITHNRFDPYNKFLKKISNRWGRHWTARVVEATGQPIGRTFSHITKAPCPNFSRVRVLFKNLGTTTPPMDKVLVAVTNTATSATEKRTPSTGVWVPLTFDGGNLYPNIPPRTSSDANVPSFYASDWVDLQSIVPVDGSNSRPYILIRTRVKGTTFTYTVTGDTSTDKDSETYLEGQYTSSAVDAITDPTVSTSWLTGNLPQFAGIEFESTENCIRVICAGDSVTAGQGASGNGTYIDGYPARASKTMRTNALNVNFLNFGFPSMTTATYVEHAKLGAEFFDASAVNYAIFSTNDGGGVFSQTVSDTQVATALSLGDYLRDMDCKLINTCISANNTFNLATDNIRKAQITGREAEALAGGGYRVHNWTSYTSDGASPERIKSGSNADNIHLNDTGIDQNTTGCVATWTPLAYANGVAA